MIDEKQLSKRLVEIAELIDDKLEKIAGERVGFSLLIHSKIAGGDSQYISNVDRKSAIDALEHQLNYWKALERYGENDMPLHIKGDLN